MPAFIATILATVGSTLLRMVAAMLSAEMVKSAVVTVLEYTLAKYEEKAKKSPEGDDDKIAASLREGLEKLKKAWEKV